MTTMRNLQFGAIALLWSGALCANVVLSFHMGMGGAGHYSWGGTLENLDPVATGPLFVVITPVDEHCRPGPLAFQSIAPLAPGEQRQVRVPLTVNNLHHYRVLLQAYDAQGFPLPSQDATQAVQDKRLSEQRRQCAQF